MIVLVHVCTCISVHLSSSYVLHVHVEFNIACVGLIRLVALYCLDLTQSICLVSSMSWVQIPPEQLFFSLEKDV